jgi:hypothetical protein
MKRLIVLSVLMGILFPSVAALAAGRYDILECKVQPDGKTVCD